MRTDSIIINLLLLIFLSVPVLATAGSLDAPVAPAVGSGMPTTTDIFNRLDTGAASSVSSSFQEPAAGPTVGTGKSLADIEGKLPVVDDTAGLTPSEAPLGKTFWGLNQAGGSWGLKIGSNPNVVDTTSGTATSAEVFCGKTAWVDGVELIGTGAFSYSDRWTDNCDGTITDKTTRLIWMKDSSGFGTMDWGSAVNACATLALDGSYGLSDGSVAGSWRLPNKDELAGLANGSEQVIDYRPGPFGGVNSSYYWSSTSNATYTYSAWGVRFHDGYANDYLKKTYNYYVRCVR